MLLWAVVLATAACESPMYYRNGSGALNGDAGADRAEDDGNDGSGMGVAGRGGGGGTVGTGGAGTGGAATGGSGTGGRGSGGALGTGGAATGGSGGRATGGAVATGGATATGGAGTGGAATGGRGTGGAATGGAATGGAATGGAAPADTAQYNFESSTQGWGMAGGGGPFATVARSTAQHFAGGASIAGTITAVAGMTYILEVAPPTPAIPAAAVITFHVYVPSGATLGAIQPYVLEGGTFRFTGNRVVVAGLTRNGWTTVKVTVPADVGTILRMGVQFESTGAWTDTVFVDSVSW